MQANMFLCKYIVSCHFNLTGAWITTSGTYCGIMKHVGKAIRDYRMDTNSQPVVVIGIVPWGKVNNRQALLNSEVRYCLQNIQSNTMYAVCII